MTYRNNTGEQQSSQNLALIANKIRQSVISDNDEVYQLLSDEVNRSPSLMKRLFPSEIDRENQRLSVEKVKFLAGKKQELIQIYFKVKLEMARIEGDTLIKAAGAHLKAELAIFVTRKIDELDSAIMESREHTMSKLSSHCECIEQYKDKPMLYNSAKRSIDNQVTNYMSTIDDLLNEFRNALKSEAR